MATVRIPIMGPSGIPDDSGDVYVLPAKIAHANITIREEMVIVFKDPSAVEEFFFSFRIPKNYVGSPKMGWNWTVATGSGNVRWETRYGPVATAESMDAALGTAVTSETGIPTAEQWKEELHTIADTLAVDDLVSVSLARGTTNDTHSDIVIVDPASVFFEYVDA
jgi:hypothetical protein